MVIKDVYAHPTIRSLLEALPEPSPAMAVAAPAPAGTTVSEQPVRRRIGTAMYVACAVMQLLILAVHLGLTDGAAQLGDDWIAAASNVLGLFLRAAAFGDAAILVMCILPIVAKWVLIGRWTEQKFPVWSLA